MPSEKLLDALSQMNALPDINCRDSKRLQGFLRTTAVEIKTVGGVSAATSLEMIGYIRELETRVRSLSEAEARRVETIKCFHCPQHIQIIKDGDVERIEQHEQYRGKPCKGSGFIVKGNWRNDSTYRLNGGDDE